MKRRPAHSSLPSTVTGIDSSSESGNALVTALVLLTLVSTGTAALLGTAVNASEGTRVRTERFDVRRSASSVNKIAARSIWSSYRNSLGGRDTSVAGLRDYLERNGLPTQNGATPARSEWVDRIGLSTSPEGDRVLGDTVIDSVLIHRVDEPRQTRLVVTTITRERSGYSGATTGINDAVTDIFSLEAARWDGLDFALLANNINCIMCHTSVDDARRVFTGDGIARGGEYNRARVGSIESFQFREDPDSSIAGTLYLGGPAIDQHGAPITDWSSFNLLGADLDGTGRIQEDLLGEPILDPMSPVDPTTPTPYGNLYTNYLDGSAQIDGTMPDTFPLPFRDDGGFDLTTGELTEGGAGNRRVDPNEFAATTESFRGTISGGSIGVALPGERVSSAASARALADGNRTSLQTVTQGNVVLTGSDIEPIRIDGDVAIDGDLIISGPIEGSGSLWVKGNIYVRGDLQYADAVAGSERQFGLGRNGGLNALGLTAGGNIVMGDPFRPQWGEGASVDGSQGGPWNFTVEQTAIFNRGEWVKTQPTLPGKPERVQVGTRTQRDELFDTVTETVSVPITERRDTGRTRTVPVYERIQTGTREEPVYATITIPSTRPAPYDNATTERVQTGTREVPVFERVQTGTREVPVMETVTIGYRDELRTRHVSFSPPRYNEYEVAVYEVQRPQHINPNYKGPNYTSRYYAFGEGDVVPIQNKKGYFDPATGLWMAEERVDGWDMSELTLADPSDSSDPVLFPATGNPAVIATLEPTGDWMDSDALKGLIEDTLTARDADEPFTVDATLYSANSIFGLVPNSRSEGTNGAIRIEGSVLSADIGLLGPGGTEILYDPRSQAVLDIRDERRIELTLLGAVPTARP